MSMAVVMSEMPDVWRKVLAEHVPDAQQNCHECFQGGSRASWPCQTYRIAQEAKWVAEGGLPGTGPHGPGPSRTRMTPPDTRTETPSDSLPGSSSALSEPLGRHGDPLESPPEPAPTTGGWAFDGRPLAGDPLGETPGATTGERPYGSTFDAPYGSSFGVDDRLHASRW
ncbi:hypothetical protein EV188_10799 [Actinomycetospora succinea]|uniref:Uncharacterized protein n=1 Tax=Actinomycetospora succinea TaxID=663603 RepID=A0A4R6V288_9PSEU|nr:hypothetical protein [Actinomycetospora succinea]TDQ52723.1 hypothetical protein EV188_10799 [Actinomycetospora succinea]